MKKLGTVLTLVVVMLTTFTATTSAQDANAITLSVRAERARYPQQKLTPTQLGEILNNGAARVPGWGLLAKPSGNNCPQPGPLETPVSCDWVVHESGVGCDILSDSENTATVVQCHLEKVVPHTNPWFVKPKGVPLDPAPNPKPDPKPDPTPDPTPDPGLAEILRDVLANQKAQIELLREQIRLQQEQTVALKAAIADLQRQVATGVKIRF